MNQHNPTAHLDAPEIAAADTRPEQDTTTPEQRRAAKEAVWFAEEQERVNRNSTHMRDAVQDIIATLNANADNISGLAIVLVNTQGKPIYLPNDDACVNGVKTVLIHDSMTAMLVHQHVETISDELKAKLERARRDSGSPASGLLQALLASRR